MAKFLETNEWWIWTKSGEWSQIEPFVQKYGPLIAIAYISPWGRTLLHEIARGAPDVPASAESIQRLAALDDGGRRIRNIEVRSSFCCGSRGNTPLEFAYLEGKIHQARALLRCGAYPNTLASAISHGAYAWHHLTDTPQQTIFSLLKNPPRTYKLIAERNILAMILNKCISIGTKQDIKQLLISIGY